MAAPWAVQGVLVVCDRWVCWDFSYSYSVEVVVPRDNGRSRSALITGFSRKWRFLKQCICFCIMIPGAAKGELEIVFRQESLGS